MRCWDIFIVIFTAGVAVAVPKSLEHRGKVCKGIYASARCCITDVQGIETNLCNRVPRMPKDIVDFEALCAGMTPRCCILPVPGWANFCKSVEL